MKNACLIRTACLLTALMAAIPTMFDLFGGGSIWQYLYNAAYIFLVLPSVAFLWVTKTTKWLNSYEFLEQK